MMPGKDGIETLREMKTLSDSKNVGTPVIMLTANAVAGARDQFITEYMIYERCSVKNHTR